MDEASQNPHSAAAAAEVPAGGDAPSAAGRPSVIIGEPARNFKSTAFDDGGALEDAEPTRPKRRRGRPPKARSRTVFDNTPITSDEMAFLRAVVQGVSPQRAALHFLPGDVHQDGRSARPYLRQLLDRLHDAAERVQTLGAPQHRAVLAELRALRREAADPLPKTSPVPEAPAQPTVASPAAATVDPVSTPAPRSRSRRPTLDEFAQRFDADMYSEADLIELYQEEYPDSSGEMDTEADARAIEAAHVPTPVQAQTVLAPAAPTREASFAPAAQQREADAAPAPRVRHALDVSSRLAMVDELAQLVAIEPTAEAPLSVWIGERLATAMRTSQGLTRLEQLATFINAHGTTWHEKIPSLGPARAARMAVWLDRHAERIGLRLRGRILAVLAPRAASDKSEEAAPAAGTAWAPAGAPNRVVSYGVVPLEDLDWPVHLLGTEGEFRSSGVNAYRAGDDRAALQAWLTKAVTNMALASQDVVRRAIERLALWALVERKQALSSLGSDDLVAFREFLYAPPAHWCGSDRVLRGSQDWRPLRGPLKAAGVRQIIVFVRQMYADWHASGYLLVNPAHKLSHHRVQTPEQRAQAKQDALAAAAAMTMNVRRSFVSQDLQAMRRELDKMPDDPFTRRLRAILSLYLDSGLRLSEVELLTLATPVPVRLDNELSDWMQITVLGKGDKPRAVPIRRSTLDALEAHYADRMALIAEKKLPPEYGEITREETPALSILQHVTRTPGKRGPGMTPADSPRKQNKDGRLAASSIAGLLKEFFKQVGHNQREHLVAGQADFAAASTHWLRHTYAHRLLYETEAKLPTVQKLLGHASLATTGLYVDADMTERVRAVGQLKAVF